MNTTQHPLVTQYLDDLARMLDHLPPGDRAEVLAGVREHIEAGLAERSGATVGDVSAVLAELGPPEDVARAAYEPGSGSGQHSDPYAVPPRPPAQPVPTPISDRRWVPVVVAILQVVGLLLVVVATLGTALYSGAETSDGVRTVQYAVGSGLMVTVASVMMALPLWIAIALLAANSSLWTTGEKLQHLLLLPVGALLIGASPDLGWIVAGERGLNVAAIASLLLVLVGGFWLVVRLTVVGRRRAGAAGPVAGPVASVAGPDSGPFDRLWVPTVVALLQGAGLFVAALVGVGAVWWGIESPGGSGSATVESGTAVLPPLVGTMMSLPLWGGVVLLVVGSTLWTPAQKWVHVMVIPVAVMVVSAARFAPGAEVASVVLLAGGIAIVTWLTMFGRRRARALLTA